MKRFIFFLPICLLLVACVSSQSTKQIDFLDEKGQVDYFNFDKDSRAITIVIPAVFNSQLDEEKIKQLAKGRRLAVISFLSKDDRNRAMQVDGMERRITYYSDVISQIEVEHGPIQNLVAEGLNATVGAKIITNFNFEQAVFLNAWKPSIKMQLVSNCYASPNKLCDSLSNYLNIGGRESIDGLLQDVETGIDRLYGNYAMRMWQQMIDYRMDDFLPAKNCPVKWIYTTNTGLMTIEKANASSTIDLYSLKEFKKLKTVF